jgi:transcriptional regulator with XRE-family HTH domain
MEIRNQTDEDWERRVGGQIRSVRLRLNLTQAEVARRANIDRTTVGRIEGGDGGSIASLVRIARVLGREDWLDSFAPAEPAVSPMQQLREQQRREAGQRKRAGRSPAVP